MSAVKSAKRTSSKPKAKAPAKSTGATGALSINAMVLKPRMSEKAYDLSHNTDTYVFEVPLNANKVEVAKAISGQFKVTVENVRMLVLKGKKARSIRIGGSRKSFYGKRPNVKKAYIKIKKGETIPIFASIDEAEEKAKKAEEKAAKKADKTTDKSGKSKKTVTAKPKAEKPKDKPRHGLFGFRRKPKEKK
ncbi:MAG: 50S ribosomal protein L23 [Candidatus Saccharimonadales bacterium]